MLNNPLWSSKTKKLHSLIGDFTVTGNEWVQNQSFLTETHWDPDERTRLVHSGCVIYSAESLTIVPPTRTRTVLSHRVYNLVSLGNRPYPWRPYQHSHMHDDLKLNIVLGTRWRLLTNRELSNCTMDGFCNSKTSNVASLPQQSSGPYSVVEMGGPMEDKFDACAHKWNWQS